MAFPVTPSSAHLLLILSFLLLGLWSSTFKLAGNRWRFELFSFDFAFGSLLCALVAAYLLGTFGSDLGFSEHLMLASRSSQALAFAMGCFFAFANMLLLAATSLLGLSLTYPVVTASALLVLTALEFTGERALFLSLVLIAALTAIVFEGIAARSSQGTLAASSVAVPVVRPATGRPVKKKPASVSSFSSTKGFIAAILSGLVFGGIILPFQSCVYGQFGVGAFAGLVLFSAGVLFATLILNVYFMNLPIQGGGLGIRSYVSGTLMQHALGLLGGAFCAAGILAFLLLNSFPADLQPDRLWIAASPLGAGLLAMLLGLSIWRELGQSPGAVTRSMLLGSVSLIAAICLFAAAMDKAPLPAGPPPQNLGLGSAQAQLPG